MGEHPHAVVGQPAPPALGCTGSGEPHGPAMVRHLSSPQWWHTGMRVAT